MSKKKTVKKVVEQHIPTRREIIDGWKEELQDEINDLQDQIDQAEEKLSQLEDLDVDD